MAKHTSSCLVCGRSYTDYDAAPRHFCSVACQADSGEVIGDMVALYTGRGRAAKTPSRVARNIRMEKRMSGEKTKKG